MYRHRSCPNVAPGWENFQLFFADGERGVEISRESLSVSPEPVDNPRARRGQGLTFPDGIRYHPLSPLYEHRPPHRLD